MSRWSEDEIPTNPGGRAHPDINNTVGLLMAEVINLRKRLEVLESLELSQKTRPKHSERPGPDMAAMATVAKKTIQWSILVIAAIISALKELGYIP